MPNYYLENSYCGEDNPDWVSQSGARFARCSLEKGHEGQHRAYLAHQIEVEDDFDAWGEPLIEELPV